MDKSKIFNIIKCVIVLIIFLLLCVFIFEVSSSDGSNKIFKRITNYEEVKKDNISYPFFDYKVIDDKINDYVVNLDNTDSLSYSVYIKNDIINVFFESVSNGVSSYNTINYDNKSDKFLSDSELYDYKIFNDQILDIVKKKYSSKIYNTIKNDNFKNAYVKLSSDGLIIYFDFSSYKEIEHKVYVSLEESKSTSSSYDKVIAFTFDDGPSNYTTEIVDALLLNESKATFFELGNRMKYNQDIVKYVINNGMEVGSHTYAHKNLNSLSEKEIIEEINSTNIIFNEITGDNIKYLRPPYGNYNEKVKKQVTTPMILWNIDTNDWLYRDSEKVYKHILEKAEDGDIVLMHDIYPETVEAVKEVLPVLKERGFKVTSISEASSIKGKVLEKKQAYRSIS